MELVGAEGHHERRSGRSGSGGRGRRRGRGSTGRPSGGPRRRGRPARWRPVAGAWPSTASNRRACWVAPSAEASRAVGPSDGTRRARSARAPSTTVSRVAGSRSRTRLAQRVDDRPERQAALADVGAAAGQDTHARGRSRWRSARRRGGTCRRRPRRRRGGGSGRPSATRSSASADGRQLALSPDDRRADESTGHGPDHTGGVRPDRAVVAARWIGRVRTRRVRRRRRRRRRAQQPESPDGEARERRQRLRLGVRRRDRRSDEAEPSGSSAAWRCRSAMRCGGQVRRCAAGASSSIPSVGGRRDCGAGSVMPERRADGSRPAIGRTPEPGSPRAFGSRGAATFRPSVRAYPLADARSTPLRRTGRRTPRRAGRP